MEKREHLGDKSVEKLCDRFHCSVDPGSLSIACKNVAIRGLRRGAMNPLIIRWLAVVFSLGAWAGIVLVVLTRLG